MTVGLEAQELMGGTVRLARPREDRRTRFGALTDFERFGYAGSYADLPGRYALLTVDFEAFRSSNLPLELWWMAMEEWATYSERLELPFSFFISVEDVALLRHGNAGSYQNLLDGLQRFTATGSAIYPHNHRVFDVHTGEARFDAARTPEPGSGYRRQASMFYDVVYRHGIDFAEWLRTVFDFQRELLAEAHVPEPRWLAFRPGGFDHGSTAEDIATYIDALEATGVTFNSSASRGIHSDGNEYVGAPFGDNIFELGDRIVEVAPSWSVDCGAGIASRSWAGAARKLALQPRVWGHPAASGALVTIIHFDHLFHERAGRRYHQFAITDAELVRTRVKRFFGQLATLLRMLRIEPVTFEALPALLASD